MNLKHFSLSEFDSPDLPGSGERMNSDFLQTLELARQWVEVNYKGLVKFIINSGFRTPAANAEAGGSVTSSHLKGLAADIRCNSSFERFVIIQALLFAGFTRIGVAENFIHVDNDPDKPQALMWTY